MNYSIIGSGNVGTALARQFARNGISVNIANTRGVESLSLLTRDLGDKVVASTLQEAVKADVVILAIPFRAHTAVAKILEDWSGKIVVDAMNTYGIPLEELKGQPSTFIVSNAFHGAKVIKSLNQLPAKLLASNPSEAGGQRVMFVSGDDENAEATIAELVGSLGFAPLRLGKINEGGRLIGLGGSLILQNLIKIA